MFALLRKRERERERDREREVSYREEKGECSQHTAVSPGVERVNVNSFVIPSGDLGSVHIAQ